MPTVTNTLQRLLLSNVFIFLIAVAALVVGSLALSRKEWFFKDDSPKTKMTLNDYHKQVGSLVVEGNSQDDHAGKGGQIKLLTRLAKNKNVTKIMEIGFNAGHSAELFLKSNPKVSVTSFDIGHHDSLKAGKKFLDNKYPNRLKLIIGNSLETIPKYIKDNPKEKFDIIFIDGGHQYEIAIGDLLNCKKLSHKDTIVIMDDTVYKGKGAPFTIGPTKAWKECIDKKIIKEISHEEYTYNRGCSWGKYL